MNSFRGYDLTILDEQAIVTGLATPESGFANRLLVCTESSLLELRKSWGKTRIEKAYNRALFTDVSLKRSFGVWKLEISTYSGELKYTGERGELERIAQFLRQWGHETDYRTETSNDSTEHTANEPNWRYPRAAPKDGLRKSTVWSQWLKGCSLIVLGVIVLLVGIVIFSDCSDDSPSTGVPDTQEATREARLNINATAVERSREAQTATATTSSPTRVRRTYTPTPPAKPSPTPTFDQLKSEAVEIDYDDLVNPTKWHIGKRIRFVAKIIQVIPVPERGENLFVLRANVTRDAHSWDDEIFLEYTGPRLFEGDIFEMVGTFVRLFTYEAVSSNDVTAPLILVVASQRVEEVDRVVITQTPIVVVETVEVVKEVVVEVEVVKEVTVEVEKEAVKEVVVEVEVVKEIEVVKEVEKEVQVVVTATPSSTPTPTSSPTLGPSNTPTPTATPSPTPEPPSTPAELVERVQDSVVRVQARSGGTFFGTASQGSGFIFAVEGTTAFVATNQHIIDGSNSVEVQIEDSTYDALVLGWDAERDVAVLSICCSSEFIALQWGDASPSEGETVIAIGYPDNDTGNIIATIGEVRAPDDLSIEHDFIPHSAPLNPGNSGGPLFAMPGGEVVGINTAGGTNTLAFYAVPYQAIEEQVEEWRSQLIVEPTVTPTPTYSTSLPKTFGPGMHIVGKDIAPGEYRAQAASSGSRFANCGWKRLSSITGETGSTLGWYGSSEGFTYVTIKPSDFAFESSGCTEWRSTAAQHDDPQPRSTFAGGTHLVGIDILPGQYKTEANPKALIGCAWERLSSTDGEYKSTIAGNAGVREGSVYVMIDADDYAFHSVGCMTWIKQ